MDISIPTFTGANWSTFKKEFKTKMSILRIWGKDDKVAEFFEVALEEGSEVYLWYEDLAEVQKKSWTALSGLIEAKYGNSVESKRRALRELLTVKLADGDVGVVGSDGEEKHITWSKKVTTLAYQAGNPGDQSTVEIVFNNVGPYTQSYLTLQNALGSVRTLATAVESMSSSCVGRIRHAASQDQRIQDLERMVRQRSQPLMSSSNNYLQPNAMGLTTSYQQQSYEPKRADRQRQEDQAYAGPIPLGPFREGRDGQAAWEAARRQWHQKYPAGQVTLNAPYPTSPGTAPPGSDECFGCGKVGHIRPLCPDGGNKLPIEEQRYRGLVASQKRRQAPGPMRGPTTGSNGIPIGAVRHIGADYSPLSEPGDLPRPMMELPLSPPMSELALEGEAYDPSGYQFLSGNGGGPVW